MSLNQDKNTFKKFDLDLEWGQHWEEYIDNIFKGVKTCEIKSERDIWTNTSNLVIEYKSRGEYSGLKTTEADIWIHNFIKDNELKFSILTKPQNIKDYINIRRPKIRKGGDNNTSEIFLVDIVDFITYLIKGR